MTITVKYSGTDAVRTVGVYPVASSFTQGEATWNVRRTATPWSTPGGDLGALSGQQSVTNVVGSRVSFDLTAIVQCAVNSASSRYTRVALADLGASTSASYREYYSMKASDPAARPVLTVIYAGDSANPPLPPPPPPGVKLRVLQYNTHHGGYGTDGVYSPDRIVSWVVKANPDIVSLQEIEMFDSWSLNQDQAALYQSKLQQATGVVWYRQWFGRAGATTGLGELLLSKYPFAAVATKLLSASRSAVDATVVVNGRSINVTSVHLDNLYQSNRLKEITELLAWEATLAENRIVVGDFNAWPTTTEIANMDQTYVDTWPAAQALGTAVGNGITHGSHRIDYIFRSKGATALVLDSQTIYNTADASGVMPSDHNPVLAVFTVR
jgi:endonuclease/exonuclease/phosphatase family metal-dependent hydrolase